MYVSTGELFCAFFIVYAGASLVAALCFCAYIQELRSAPNQNGQHPETKQRKADL